VNARRRFLVAAGAALAAPASLAQRTVRIGLLNTTTINLRTPSWKPFFAAMEERGWKENGNYSVLTGETRGDPERGARLAREMVDARVDVILAIATATALAARKATARMPIVTWCGYPVEAGLAESLSRPGGNVTGVANYAGADIWGKFVELLRELRPGLRRVGVLWDYAPPAFPDGPVAFSAVEAAVVRMGLESRLWLVRSEQDLDAALAQIEREPFEGLVMTSGGGIHNRANVMPRIGELVTRRRLAAITDVAGTAHFFQTNCVLAYSPNVQEILTRLADLVHRVLHGAKPAELPFERPSRFDLSISSKAARLMELAVPQALLLRADRVIE
jgi:putative ABC transport system substrate-binding protein